MVTADLGLTGCQRIHWEVFKRENNTLKIQYEDAPDDNIRKA
jgi:hypothetical protein